MKKRPVLTIILPVYNEGKTVKSFFLRLKSIVDEIGVETGYCVVDDGSTDQTWEVIKGLSMELGPDFRAQRFSRNFGKEAAIIAGLNAVESDFYLVMDADGQHPPELIPRFFEMCQTQHFDVINGLKAQKDIKFSSRVFGYLFNKLTGFDLLGASDFKLISHQARNALLTCGDQGFFFRGLTEWVGFRKANIVFSVPERVGGASKWGKKRLFSYALNAFLLNTYRPLYFLLAFGLFCMVVSGLIIGKVLISYFFHNVPPGYPTLVMLPFMSFGTIIFSIGIIGLYVAKVLEQNKGRPRYIVMEELAAKKDLP
ncbi:MAG: glycosyltransferase family 2 protein [Thermodesulfobacteriota bacterium]